MFWEKTKDRKESERDLNDINRANPSVLYLSLVQEGLQQILSLSIQLVSERRRVRILAYTTKVLMGIVV